jgi:tetratricopeptide (TPR) repeat protein
MRASFIAIGLALASCGGALADAESDCVQDKDQDLRIRGCTAAIQLDKGRGEGLAWAYYNRGNAYKDKGEVDRAMADYDQAVRLDPKNSSYVRQLGITKYNKGDFQGAAADLLHAFELKDDIYAMRFRYLARTQAGEAAETELQANAGRRKTKVWPYAVTDQYLGKRRPAATLDVAGDKPLSLPAR